MKDADAKLVEREKEGVHPGKVMAVTGGDPQRAYSAKCSLWSLR